VSPVRALLMVRPAWFAFDPETAATNVFQKPPGGDGGADPAEVHRAAVAEFDGLVAALRRARVQVVDVDDTETPRKPDAVFPCNWISFHPDGTVILYPLQAPVRRLERRPEIVHMLESDFDLKRVVDLSAYEDESRFLEGSGSLVFDDADRCIYCSVSGRTDPELAREVADLLSYDLEIFAAADQGGRAIYHTDVVLALGSRFAVVAAETIADAAARERILKRLAESGRDVVTIDFAQVARFAGNVIEVGAADGEGVVVMSDAAKSAFTALDIRTLERSGPIVHAPLPTIEWVGGGSARCMVADIRLPRRSVLS
jgi:hypothetical protein